MYSNTNTTWVRVLGTATVAALLLGMLPIQFYSAHAQSEEEEEEELVEEVSATGTLIIVKEVTEGSSTSTTFMFESSWGAEFALKAGESTTTTLAATGTYAVIESVPEGWNAPEVTCLSSDEDIEMYNNLTVGADEVITCTFLNDEADDEVSTTTEDTYVIEGYVWHDDNENKIWDGFGEEGATTTEDDLQGWTVKITDGETVKSAVTDANGYYAFEVTAGTWTITEELKDGWKLTTPVSGEHVVTVPDPVATSSGTSTEEVSLLDRVFNFFIPTAHAAVVDTKGPYNFGNNEVPVDPNNGGSGGSSGGGGSSSPRCDIFTAELDDDEIVLEWETRRGSDIVIEADGRRVYTESDNGIVAEGSTTIDDDGQDEFVLTVTRNSRKDTCEVELDRGTRSGSSGSNSGSGTTPTPQVLGEQVSVVPQGAPNAGAGGTATLNLTTLTGVHFLRKVTV